MIIDGEFIGDQLRIEFVVRVADHFARTVQTEPLRKFLTYGNVTTKMILDEVMNAMQGIDQLQQLTGIAQSGKKFPLNFIGSPRVR